MYKKIILTLGLSLMFTFTSTKPATAAIDTSQVNSGIISVNHKSNNGAAVRIIKGKQQKDYILNTNNKFPLSFGDGQYTVLLLEKVQGNKYKQVEKKIINLDLKDKNDLYLQSTQMINWNKDMNAVKLAKDLTKNVKTDKEKLTIIYNYITENIKYDQVKASKPLKGYIPNIEQTLESKDGICYDYSSLLASMLRSLEIPTKLEMGRKNDIDFFHAWNRVYLKETKEWVLIDTTYDAAFVNKNLKTPMIKNEKEYTVENQY